MKSDPHFPMWEMKQESVHDHSPLHSQGSEKKAKSSAAETISSQESQEEAKTKKHHDADILKCCVAEMNGMLDIRSTEQYPGAIYC